jgi:hypothetical protein
MRVAELMIMWYTILIAELSDGVRGAKNIHMGHDERVFGSIVQDTNDE